MKFGQSVGVGKWMIGTGVLLMLAALALWIWGGYEQQALLQQYAVYAAALPSVSPASEAASSSPAATGELDAGLGNLSIGILSIPSLGVEAPLAEGIEDEALKYAVGHFTGTAAAGQAGNFCVAGHSSGVYQPPFAKLGQLVPGDSIVVRQNGLSHIYQVTEILTVQPEDVWVLDPTVDAQVTLVTCTPPLFPTHRLIVRGVLAGEGVGTE